MATETSEVVVQGVVAVLTAKELITRARVIDEVFNSVMKNGIHYGTIPGCGDKPALFKGGAEKLQATFGIASEIVVADLSSADEIRYRVESRATSIASGAYLGSGVGECSSSEEKYRWRKATNDKEYDATPEDRKRIKWANGKTGAYAIKQVRTNPADVANTVLKMSAKRGRVDMTLTVLGCSDLFTQDFDEDDTTEPTVEPPAPLKEPQARPATAPDGGVVFDIDLVASQQAHDELSAQMRVARDAGDEPALAAIGGYLAKNSHLFASGNLASLRTLYADCRAKLSKAKK